MISVIIPTRNRAQLLKKTLWSITKQTLPNNDFEVLVIDNGSTDDTFDIVTEYYSLLKNLKYFYEPAPGLHSGRHRGLKESSGEILTFADDDIDAFPTWLEGIQTSFLNKKIALVGGKNIPQYESHPPDWLEELWLSVKEGKYMPDLSLLDFGEEVKEVEPYFIFGCNFSVRKDVLNQIKGFHPDGMPQTLIRFRGDGETHVAEQVKKLGYASLYHPKASIYHLVPSSRMSVEYLEKRAFNEGISGSYADTRREFLEKKKVGLITKIKRRVKIFFSVGLKRKLKQSYMKGYLFHQKELQRDKHLIEWVLKDSYLNHV
jgi:glycosyltransferase involved in cell wall biosynthesis